MYILLILLTFISISSSQIYDFQTICQAGIRQDNTNYIHCGRKQLKQIPNFTRITNTFYDELVLNDNQIIEISSNAFHSLRIKRLNLSGNKIRLLSLNAFMELSNYLEELIIEFDSNYINDIPYTIKNHLINIRSLKLINLNITILKNSTFSKFRKLEQLSIIKSNIKFIEIDAFILLNNLNYLNLEQNSLNDLSWYSIKKYLNNLEILILNQNKFSLLKQINFSYLKTLDLSSNGLQIINIEYLPLLEKFYLQNNELNSLQLKFLLKLKNLKELNIDFNRLTFIAEKIFENNFHLNYLSLQGNDLNFLTNYSFYNLKNLIYLNLARNNLQFQYNYQPFQYLKSLKILNLDRNFHMNLTKNILEYLSLNLIELSLQNCNITLFNYTLDFFLNLQRLKLSSNNLKFLPKNFLNYSIISIDLQRNFFTTIPNLYSNQSLKLIDLDLSSNQISILNENNLLNYPNLKTLGLTGNPLNCNCHLKWIKQWLKKNYHQDLIKFLQWTCAKPEKFFGKQLTIIHEEDMTCDENEDIDHKTIINSTLPTILSSTNVVLVPIKNNNIHTSTGKSTLNEVIINDIVYHSNGILIISWDYMLSQLPKYYHIQIYDENHHYLIFQRLIDGKQRSIEINISQYFLKLSSFYIICINIQYRKYCRKSFIQLNTNLIKSSSLIVSSNKQVNEQFIYIIGGILLGAILICSILIIICYYRLCYYSKENISSINKDDKFIKTFYYHPLNIISYPQQQQQQSNNTSECSLHSSTDTSHLTNDPYHIYQQISSIHNCQIHSKITPIQI